MKKITTIFVYSAVTEIGQYMIILVGTKIFLNIALFWSRLSKG